MADAADLVMRALALPVSGFILANGLDDLFIDLNYFARGLFRRRERRVSVDDLKRVPPQRIAIMVPAWQEAEVIEQMLDLNLGTIDYPADHYDFFVGTYANDLETQARVDAVARRAPNVHRITTPHDGPTCKADNLNWVYQGLKLLEERRGQRFDILLMQDAEDIIHPLALYLYNFHIPRHDFIQTPVFPLPTPWHRFVAGTYVDEFTEYHLKDMLVRERVGGLVPSAGVGSAFARDSFEEIAFAHSQQAFNPASVTEDYEIGMKFRLAGKRALFLTRAVGRLREAPRGVLRTRVVTEEVDEYIATREYFPDSFQASVRQRSRWVLGIALQAWEQIGWRGGLPVLYCLWRDRKALLTSYVGPLGYVVALYCLFRWAAGAVAGPSWSFEAVFPPGSLLWYLVLANTGLIGWRVMMKFVTVEEIYGTGQALLSIPRFFVSNVINLVATTRAIQQFAVHKITGRPVRWLKTAHSFPSSDVLRSYRRSIGELLVQREGLTPEDLEGALALQQRTGLPLGRIMVAAGISSPDALARTLGDQLALPTVNPNPNDVPAALLRRLDEEEATRRGVLPLEIRGGETVVLAISRPPDTALQRDLEGHFGGPVSFAFCEERRLARARARAYRRLERPPAHPASRRALGALLVAAGHLAASDLEALLQAQEHADEPLGELAVRRGLVPPEVISTLLRQQGGLPFRTLAPAELDPALLGRVGYGRCALHGLVPLVPDTPRAPPRLAAAHPVHPEVLALCATHAGQELVPLLAPALDVRLLQALGARTLWPPATTGGLTGLDAAELAVLGSIRPLAPHLERLPQACRAAGQGPLDHLQARGVLPAGDVARLRGQVLGIPLVPPELGDAEGSRQLLTAELADAHGLRVLDRGREGLVVAGPHPTPALARRVAALFPDAPVAWRLQGRVPEHRPSRPPRPAAQPTLQGTP